VADGFCLVKLLFSIFLARDVIYRLHLALMLRCQCPSVCPSVCDGSALAHYS